MLKDEGDSRGISYPNTITAFQSSRYHRNIGTSLVAQWLRIRLPGFPGGAVVESLPANAGDTGSSLVWEDPTCRGATGPVSHNY